VDQELVVLRVVLEGQVERVGQAGEDFPEEEDVREKRVAPETPVCLAMTGRTANREKMEELVRRVSQVFQGPRVKLVMTEYQEDLEGVEKRV